ncbi:MAG: hypothetical protein LJE97_02665 [Betaproteobacteria bacterium]|jgi:hypothetical protein|nr:hypothetical protein [Betaproteobacteria bacterium]
MSLDDQPLAAELVRLTRAASETRDLNTLVSAQHQMRLAIRHALVSWNWSDLDAVQDELKDSPSLRARFNENLHHVLETPELAAHGPGATWRGLVLAIPVTATSREGELISFPQPLASGLRESLQAQFPDGTGIRLINRLLPQLVAHSLGTRSLYELVEELASGQDRPEADLDAHLAVDFAPHGQCLGRHYVFALAFTADPEQFALEVSRDLRHEAGLVNWAAAQTETITNDFAERGWHVAIQVFAPQRLQEMLSLPPLLSDMREVDALLDHVASQHATSITALRADLSVKRGREPALQISLSDRGTGTPLARSLYQLAPLAAGADAYRVAVRLASAGVDLAAADDTLRRAVERALTLTDAAPESEKTGTQTISASRTLETKVLWARITRSLRHPS